MTNFTSVRGLLVTLCVLVVIRGSYSSDQTKAPKNVLCYYLIEASTHSAYNMSDIDPTLCTHLVYYTTWIENGTTVQTSANVFDHTANWEELQNLKLSNPSLKVILAVDDLRKNYPEYESYENRQIFINHVIDLLRTWKFDGLCWSKYGYLIKKGIVAFIMELHGAIMAEAKSSGREPLIFMLSVPGWGGIIEGVDLHPLGQAVDIVNVTPHGIGSIKPVTRFVSPMYGNAGEYGNVSASITNYLDAGIPSEKLHMTIRVTAKTFTLEDPENTGVGAPASSNAEPGEYTNWKDRVAYYEVCKRLQEEGYTAEFDPEGLVNFAYKGNQWMTYEDPASLEIKMDYVYDNNLGGVAVLFLHDDDYTGQFCNQGRYPLLSFLYRRAVTAGCPDGQVFVSSKGCIETTCRVITLPKTEL